MHAAQLREEESGNQM